ncbi:MAG: 4Fe-4S binding protein [Candidatus Desulfatibia sp.]|uniref:ATP-binding protein n=1 Tax=Candidatus Desulfatibia sp. TaxID=3101189 RepID=UPI002F3116AA
MSTTLTRKIVEIDEELCDGCGLCIPSCAEGALEIVDGKARIIEDKLCDGLGACLGECPTDAIKIIEREADEFDEEAVHQHLAEQEKAPEEETLACGCPSDSMQSFGAADGCPSAGMQTFAEAGANQAAGLPAAAESEAESALSHWPVQIMLVPAQAPFLKGADLLVVADCVPIAYPSFHRDFLQGKAVVMGCPKLDDAQHYIDKFAEICKYSGVNSITIPIIEVPCCSGLPIIVKKGMEKAGVKIPIEEIVISTRGKILKRTRS